MSEKNKTMVLNTNLIREADWLSSEDLVLTLANRSGADSVNSQLDGHWAVIFDAKKVPDWWKLKGAISEMTRGRVSIQQTIKQSVKHGDLVMLILKVIDPRKDKPVRKGFRLKFRKSGRITLTDRDSGYHFGPESPSKVVAEINRLIREGYAIEDASRLLDRVNKRRANSA